MNDYATHAAAMAAIQNRLGDDCPTIQFADKDWKLIPDTAHRRQDLGPGGFSMNADLVFEALVSTFAGSTIGGTVIQTAVDLKDVLLQQVIGYMGDGYRVMAVGIRPGGFQVMVECNSSDQGA